MNQKALMLVAILATPASGINVRGDAPAVIYLAQKTVGVKMEVVSQTLVADLGKALTKKQLDTINSGFSTFSHLKVYFSADPDNHIIRKACTVKLDMWEERYVITVLAQKPLFYTVKDLDTFRKLCLNVEIADTQLLNTLRSKDAELKAELILEQISPTQAKSIKDWLIKQQSVMMQRLFSHMLGELQLSETSIISLAVPK